MNKNFSYPQDSRISKQIAFGSQNKLPSGSLSPLEQQNFVSTSSQNFEFARPNHFSQVQQIQDPADFYSQRNTKICKFSFYSSFIIF